MSLQQFVNYTENAYQEVVILSALIIFLKIVYNI